MKLTAHYFTIANKYRHEPHPASEKLGVELHPDGYVTVMAETPGIARDIANMAMCRAWCMQKEEMPDEDPFLYPRGNLTTIT